MKKRIALSPCSAEFQHKGTLKQMLEYTQELISVYGEDASIDMWGDDGSIVSEIVAFREETDAEYELHMNKEQKSQVEQEAKDRAELKRLLDLYGYPEKVAK